MKLNKDMIIFAVPSISVIIAMNNEQHFYCFPLVNSRGAELEHNNMELCFLVRYYHHHQHHYCHQRHGSRSHLSLPDPLGPAVLPGESPLVRAQPGEVG